MRLAVLVASAISLVSPALAMPLPDCANEIAVGHAQVARLEKDGTLTLTDGHAIVLEGIHLPGMDRSDTLIAAEALGTLKQLAMRAPLVLAASGPKQDRYGRVRVQAFDHVWLQTALLERGLARVE